MTIPFNPPKPRIAVMALSVLGATASATAEPTNEEATVASNPSGSTVGAEASPASESAALMMCSPKRSLSELTRHLVSHPTDEAALSAVCLAMNDGGQIEELMEQLALLSNVEQGDSLPDHAMAELAFRIAKGCSDAHARELCRAALDLCAVHVAALALFEELADASWSDELCARYQVFLEDAPMHGIAPDVCETVSNKLAEAERSASVKQDDLDPMYGLCETLKRAFALVVSGVDSVADRQFLDVLGLQA